MTSLAGKVALVTGAASGLGEASARRLRERGAEVACADLVRRDAGDIVLDVADETAWSAAIAHVVSRFGGLDILVNAAGISLENDTLDACPAETWQRTMAVNLDGTFLGCKHAIPAMRARGSGSIVNFGSINSIVADGEAIAYVASKGAVRLLTRSTALHCARSGYGIRCNLVCPGYVETPMLARWLASQPEAVRQRIVEASPMRRLAQPSEVANLVAWLASDEAASATGGEFAVDGGYLAT